ncbi:MAG: VWA domain-containing protein [Oscillospiraceae bacterium]
MKKRILSLVLCAAMLLSMCLFLGAGVLDDASDAPAESTEAAEVQAPQTVVYTAAGPFLPAVSVQPVLRAARASSANEPKDGLNLSKTATANADGSYKIRMEAFTTGKVTTTTSIEPCDIVLVLDQSGSMAYDFNGNSTNNNTSRRQYAMKQAVNRFIDAVADKYDAEKSDHRIAVVTFGTNASVLKSWTTVSESGKTELQISITGLPSTPSGATNVGAGMKKAETLMGRDYNYTGSSTTRQKVVVVFTDGVPTTESDFSTTVANAAIQSAKALKDSDATVYSVGIFNGANPKEMYGASGFDTNSNGTVNSKWVKDKWGLFPGTDFPEADRPAGNRFLNLLSSNFKDATEVGLKRETYGYGVVHYKITYTISKKFKRTSSSYYLTAKDSASLNQIFTTISENIGQASIDLSSSTVVKDIVTPYFTMPANTADVKLYTADYNGASFGAEQPAGSDVRATIDANANTVSVTGFDFNKYYVSTNKKPDNTYGKKLIIEFDVSVADGFLGGNNVPTNGDTSGVYTEKGVSAGLFDVPKVNVPIIAPELAGQDCHVYYLGTQPTPEQMCTPYDTAGSDFSFVKVSYTTSGSVDMTQDGSYTVTATVSPQEAAASDSDGAPAQPATATATSNVYVYKPELTFKDSEGYYGDTAPDFDSNLTNTVWKHGETEANTAVMGEAPELTLTYTPDADAIVDGKINTRQDIGVAVTVKSGDQDVTNATTFLHTNCAGKTCTLPDGKAFLLHVNTCSLTISKTVTGQNNGQSFVFTVKDANGNVITTVAVKGGASKTITGLPIGTYTVTEDTQWSWQYNLTSGNDVTKELKANAAEDYAAADFTNEYKGTNWLTSIADVINKWVSATQIQQIPAPETN